MAFRESHLESKSNKPTVCHIASGDLWAGAEVQLFTLVKTLHCTLGVPVSVILLNHGDLERKLRQASINVTVFDETQLGFFQILSLLTKAIQTLAPDVIHTHRTKENILGSIAALKAGRIPTIRTTHGAPEYAAGSLQYTQRAIQFIDWFAGRFIQQRIISVSAALAEILKLSFPPSIIRVIDNGVDIDLINRNAHSISSHSDLNEDVFKVGFVGRLSPVKRVDIFIKMAHYVKMHYPDLAIRFQIFGSGPMRNELESLCTTLNVEHIVVFEGHCSDIESRINNLDVLVITSDHEGLPMTLLEAMALRVPVVSHAIGGIPDVLDNGSCGVLIQEQCPSAFGREIYRLAISPHLRTNIANCAHSRVTNHYSAEINAQAYLSEYQNISRHSARIS